MNQIFSNLFIKVFMILILTISGSFAFAQTRKAFKLPTVVLRGHQHYYTGAKNKSFSDTQTGYGLTFHKLLKYEFLVPYFGVGLANHQGRQSFLDDRTEVITNYAFQSGTAELGLYLFPAGRVVKGMSFYVNGAGVFSYNLLSLDKSKTFTKISNTDQNYSSGYKGAVGFEWILSKHNKGARWSLYGEVGFKKESTVLVKQNFSLDALTYTLGLAW